MDKLYMRKWVHIIMPREFKEGEFTRIKWYISKIYGFEFSDWEVVSYLIRYYKQKSGLYKQKSGQVRGALRNPKGN